MFNRFFQYLSQNNHRGLIVLEGERQDITGWATHFLAVNKPCSALWVGNQQPEMMSYPFVTFKQIVRFLGTENHIVVFDAYSGFSPNAFCSVVDTVTGGGLVLLLVPPLNGWPQLRDDDFSSAYQVEHSPRQFIQRMIRSLQKIFDQSFVRCVDKNNVADFLQAKFSSIAISISTEKVFSAEQDAVVKGILRVIDGRSYRPLVINAARGRGKSTALGRALIEWLARNDAGKIIVTGPDLNSVSQAFQEIQAHYAIPLVNGCLIYQQAVIEFWPVDRILLESPQVVALVVEEAAALPISVLKRLLNHYPKMVFLSTTVGYEGSGRGFVLKFVRLLDDYSKQWRRLSLTQSLRWAEHDPLEQWINQTFILDDAIPLQNSDDVFEFADEQTIRPVSPEELLRDEALLQSLFRLLVNAHYRTQPDDLRYMLDMPDVKIYAGFVQGQIVSAALVVEETAFSLEQVDKLQQSVQRPRGHLLAQTLAFQEGLYDAFRLSMWRIVRIAVQPELQGKRFGSELLASISISAQQSGVDALGSSFALDPDVLNFWLSADFYPLRLGYHRDHVSASFALMVLKPFSADAENVVASARRRFSEQCVLRLSMLWSDVDPIAIVRLLRSLPFAEAPNEIDLQQCRDYIRSASAYESTWYALQKVLIWQLVSNTLPCDLSRLTLPVRCILQRWSWSALAVNCQLSGRKAVEQQLKESLSIVLNKVVRQPAADD